MPSTELIAGLVAPALQVWLAGAMIRRKLHSQFPLFFAYTLYSIVVIAVRLSVAKQPRLFFALYWITEIIYGALALLAVGEVFSDVLELRSNQHRWWRFAPATILLSLVTIFFWRATYCPFGPNVWGALGAGAYSFGLGVLCVQAGIFLLALFRLKAFSGILSKQHNAGILRGFGVFGLLTMTAYVTRSYFGARFEDWFRYIPPGAYIMATLTWLTVFLHQEPPDRKPSATSEFVKNVAEGLSRDHEALKKIEKDLPPQLRTTFEAGN
jgi:hypothetical protein